MVAPPINTFGLMPGVVSIQTYIDDLGQQFFQGGKFFSRGYEYRATICCYRDMAMAPRRIQQLDRFATYDEEDFVWAVPLGLVKIEERTLMPGDRVNLSKFMTDRELKMIVDDVKIERLDHQFELYYLSLVSLPGEEFEITSNES